MSKRPSRADALAALDDAYLECRVANHAWSLETGYGARIGGQVLANFGWSLATCTRCHMRRRQVLDPYFQIRETSYETPRGYGLPGRNPAWRAEARAEYWRRTAPPPPNSRRPRPRSSPQRCRGRRRSPRCCRRGGCDGLNLSRSTRPGVSTRRPAIIYGGTMR